MRNGFASDCRLCLREDMRTKCPPLLRSLLIKGSRNNDNEEKDPPIDWSPRGSESFMGYSRRVERMDSVADIKRVLIRVIKTSNT